MTTSVRHFGTYSMRYSHFGTCPIRNIALRDKHDSEHSHFGTCHIRTSTIRDKHDSEHSHFGTCHIRTSTIRDCTTALVQVIRYRQIARKVGPSANSALICCSSSANTQGQSAVWCRFDKGHIYKLLYLDIFHYNC